MEMDDLQRRGKELVEEIDGSLHRAYGLLGFLAGMVVGSFVAFFSMWLMGRLR